MNTTTISKREYLDLKREQEKMSSELSSLKAVIVEFIKREEVRPSVIKRLGRQSGILDRGKGRAFSGISQFKRYLRTL